VITYTFRTLEFDAPKLHPVFFQIVEFEREVSVAQRSFELELERQHVTLPANVIDFETARSARASITEASVDTEVGVGGKHDTVEAAVEFVTGQYSTGFVSEQDGLFTSKEAAEAYAATIDALPEWIEVVSQGEVWMVKVRPYDEMRECIAGGDS